MSLVSLRKKQQTPPDVSKLMRQPCRTQHYLFTRRASRNSRASSARFKQTCLEWKSSSLPTPLSEQVTVTATRTETRLGDTAASIISISSTELSTTAALALDDALRQVPGFSLFRRSGSRTANPTSQGVSLRGTGASGASRAIVMADGIPLNDPFGGWVYWSRVPRTSINNIEVLRGGASHLYGSAALGGVVNIFTRKPRSPVFLLETSYGNQQTADASLFAAGRKGRWAASISAETFRTDGYIIVDERERGTRGRCS